MSSFRVKIRETHPNLFRSILTFALTSVALGVNFFIFVPTFLIYGMPNYVWGTGFLLLGGAQLLFLNIRPHLNSLRAAMALNLAYMTFIAIGATQPLIQGKGSAQLPIVYSALISLQLILLLEPFINRTTSKVTDVPRGDS